MDEPTTDLDAREAQFAKRSLVLAFFCGLLLASLISAGVIGERLQAGSVRAALLVDLVVLVAGIFATVLTARPLNVRFENSAATARLRRSRGSVPPSSWPCGSSESHVGSVWST
jgi:hypothetical protein